MDSEKKAGGETAAERKSGWLLPLLALIAAAALIAFVAWGVWTAMHPKAAPLQGQIDATTIDVAAKIPGRIEQMSVKEGDQVAKGGLIARIAIPELEAKVRQAKAVESARAAQASLADEGARPQEIAAARALYERAAAAAELAQKTHDRVASLYKQGFVPAQKLDEAVANLKASRKAAAAAKEQWSIAQTGARRQEKAATKALAAQAAGAVDEVSSYAKEAEVTAPQAGEVSRVMLRAGEVAPQGFPLVTLVDLSDQWAAFNLREELLADIRMGTVLQVKIPALGAVHPFRVYFISPKADYATWRATRQDAGYDARTFEVRARPEKPIEGLRPGMTALIER